MRRFGLALSGGGFRATLFHLGLVRYLSETGRLGNITHICAVSGGSILAAHLVQNWARYNGGPEEFDAAAGEVLRLVQCDVRNRIVRRYPLVMLGRAARMLALRPDQRQWTLTGLLERHYRQYLFGDTCLHELPEAPRLYLLATNLSEGRLCGFTRGHLLRQRRLANDAHQFEQIPAGLATLAMAVTASSAFPGFFPPYQLTAGDLGATGSHFERQTFTDGGVYDNLGIRMFRFLERPWLAHEVRPSPSDCGDLAPIVAALQAAAPGTPLHRLTRLLGLDADGVPPEPGWLLDQFWRVMTGADLAHDPVFSGLRLPPDARQDAHQLHGELDQGERVWLNRQVIDAAFQAALGRPCFVTPTFGFDGVLVSDAGKSFKVASEDSHGGLIRTAVRSTDIVMNRVWELDNETFSDTPGCVFARITHQVDPADDPTAPHPEVQRQVRDIRTDFDRFSPLEIQSLVQHGYCVARAVCRARPELFGALPDPTPPWDPLAASTASPSPSPSPTTPPTTPAPACSDADGHADRPDLVARVRAAVPHLATPGGAVPPGRALHQATARARALQRSAERRVWSTLFDVRDWVSYLYIPILIPILVLLPLYLTHRYNQSQVAWRLIQTMAQGSPDLDPLTNLLQNGPVTPFQGLPVEVVQRLQTPDNDEFEVISDNRLLDFRATRIDRSGHLDPEGFIYGYRRVQFRKRPTSAHLGPITGAGVSAATDAIDGDGGAFVIHVRALTTHMQVRCRNPRLNPRLRMFQTPDGQEDIYELILDTRLIPPGQIVDAVIEFHTQGDTAPWNRTLRYYFESDTRLAAFWLLLPDREPLDSFELIRYPTGRPGAVEAVQPWRQVADRNLRIIFFGLLGVKSGYTYECRWSP